MTVGGAALITDHVWLVDQRDVLKTAAEAASIAATLEIDRQLAGNPLISDKKLKNKLKPVARRYVLANLSHLAPERFRRAEDSLVVKLDLDRRARTVGVTAKADLGGTLFSRNLPLLGSYKGPKRVVASAGVESVSVPVEVVLAIDVSGSMDSDLHKRWSLHNSRLAIVQSAARDLVAILDPNGHNRVAVGIVPWSSRVRLDVQSAGKWAEAGWADHAGTDPPSQAWQGCLDKHRRIYAGTPRVPAPTAAALFELPENAPFVQATCVKHLVVTHVVTHQFMPTLTPLNTERVAIEASIDALVPIAGTYSSLGVLWAQRMLEPAWKGVWWQQRHPPRQPLDPRAREAQEGHRAPHRWRRQRRFDWRFTRRGVRCGEVPRHRNLRRRRDAPARYLRQARRWTSRLLERGRRREVLPQGHPPPGHDLRLPQQRHARDS